jgi:hypothetical protein
MIRARHEVDQVHFALRKLENELAQRSVRDWKKIDQLADTLEKTVRTLKEELKK